jgi:hypothetical protein
LCSQRVVSDSAVVLATDEFLVIGVFIQRYCQITNFESVGVCADVFAYAPTCFRFFSVVLATDEFVVFGVVCPLCSPRVADSFLLLLLMGECTLCSGLFKCWLLYDHLPS